MVSIERRCGQEVTLVIPLSECMCVCEPPLVLQPGGAGEAGRQAGRQQGASQSGTRLIRGGDTAAGQHCVVTATHTASTLLHYHHQLTGSGWGHEEREWED